MSGAELMLLGAVAGGAMDKQNPMRGAILGGAMGGVGAGMMGGAGAAGAATKGAATSGLLTPTGYGGTTFLTAAPQGASSGLFSSLANANNPFGNQLMQSVLSSGQPNQQVVSGGGMKQGTSPQFFSAGNNTGVNSNEEQIDEDELLLRLIASRSKSPKGLISISGGNNQNAMVV